MYDFFKLVPMSLLVALGAQIIIVYLFLLEILPNPSLKDHFIVLYINIPTPVGKGFVLMWQLLRWIISLNFVPLSPHPSTLIGYWTLTTYLFHTRSSQPWFSTACATTIGHRNRLFHMYHANPTDETRALLKVARDHCRYVLNKVKECKPGQVTHWCREVRFSWVFTDH